MAKTMEISVAKEHQFLSAALLCALLLAPALAHSQQTNEPVTPQQFGQQKPHQQIAQRCMNDLQAFNQHIQKEGYWVTGLGTRWGTRAPDRPGTVGTSTVGAPLGQPFVGTPWGPEPTGLLSPRYQIRVLYGAAHVLAYRGDEAGCQRILTELRDVYGSHVEQLRKIGVEPGQVTTWRQERIAAAQPVDKLPISAITIDQLTGAEVRNKTDEFLGNVNDVIIDRETGEISYVVVGRGGFLGIGTDDVAVPWRAFSASPSLNLFVLDVSESAFELAPELADTGWFQDPKVYQQDRQRIDQFWKQHIAG